MGWKLPGGGTRGDVTRGEKPKGGNGQGVINSPGGNVRGGSSLFPILLVVSCFFVGCHCTRKMKFFTPQ